MTAMIGVCWDRAQADALAVIAQAQRRMGEQTQLALDLRARAMGVQTRGEVLTRACYRLAEAGLARARPLAGGSSAWSLTEQGWRRAGDCPIWL
jgi:hypothetical protein